MTNAEGYDDSDSPLSRSRWTCALIVVGIIVLGLTSRKIDGVPIFLRDHAGDALWAAMVYWGFAFLFPKATTVRLAVAALGFSFAIEFSQLIRHPVLDSIRAHPIGALILGHGFLWIDLVRYLTGIVLSAAADWVRHRISRH